MILLFIMFASAIIKVKQICGQDMSAFNLGSLCKKCDSGQERASCQSDPPECAQASSPSTETSDQALEEAIKKARENFAALSSIKNSCKTK